MKYWNLELFPKSVFNLETAGCRDIFQVDAAKTRGHPFYCRDDLFGVLGIQANRVGVDICELLEQHCLSFHHRRSEEHTSELQSRGHLVCRLLLEKKKKIATILSMT